MVDIALEEAIRNCVADLRIGMLAIIPTDAGLELAANPDDRAALEHMKNLVGRDGWEKGSVLLADPRDILTFVAAPPPDIIAIVGNFTRPTAALFEGILELPNALAQPSGKTALRVPNNLFCRALVKRLGHPVFCVPAPRERLVDISIRQYTDGEVTHSKLGRPYFEPLVFVEVSDDGIILPGRHL